VEETNACGFWSNDNRIPTKGHFNVRFSFLFLDRFDGCKLLVQICWNNLCRRVVLRQQEDVRVEVKPSLHVVVNIVLIEGFLLW
jgi:hypothetical protein